eukprot:1161500-Pelagomonas_calceolata.AAC.5
MSGARSRLTQKTCDVYGQEILPIYLQMTRARSFRACGGISERVRAQRHKAQQRKGKTQQARRLRALSTEAADFTYETAIWGGGRLLSNKGMCHEVCCKWIKTSLFEVEELDSLNLFAHGWVAPWALELNKMSSKTLSGAPLPPLAQAHGF